MPYLQKVVSVWVWVCMCPQGCSWLRCLTAEVRELSGRAEDGRGGIDGMRNLPGPRSSPHAKKNSKSALPESTVQFICLGFLRRGWKLQQQPWTDGLQAVPRPAEHMSHHVTCCRFFGEATARGQERHVQGCRPCLAACHELQSTA